MAATVSDAPAVPLTKEKIMKLCVEQGYYRTPSCNEKLYLHHKGFDAIGGLEEYTEVKVLWLEGNHFSRIENVSHLVGLRQLYLHQNAIARIEGLEALTALDSLNLSDNYISCLSGLDSQAQCLTMLQLKNNRISTVDSFEHLQVLKKLGSLDLTGNKIEDGEALLTILATLPSLRSLHLSGNPCVRTITNYRKTVISRLPELLYLDEKPVFKDERRLVTAWARGGVEAERAEKKLMREEEEAAIRQRLDEFRSMVDRARAERGEVPTPNETNTEDEHDSQPSDNDSDDGAVWIPGEVTPSGSSAQPHDSRAPSSAAQSESDTPRNDPLE